MVTIVPLPPTSVACRDRDVQLEHTREGQTSGTTGPEQAIPQGRESVSRDGTANDSDGVCRVQGCREIVSVFVAHWSGDEGKCSHLIYKCVCMCVCASMSVHVCVCMCVCKHVCACVCASMYVHVCVQACVCMCVCVCACVCASMYVHVCMYFCMIYFDFS